MLGRFAKVAPEYAREMTKALRMYLRFLASNGACRAELFNAVSSVPQSRLATLPRYIPTDDIERKIASCDLTRAAGLRDRAILLLLACPFHLFHRASQRWLGFPVRTSF